MNDPLELIKKDHEALKALFAEFEGLDADAVQEREDLCERVIHELTLHMELEETLCYPRFKEFLTPEDGRLIEEAYLEHQEAKNLMEQLKGADETSEARTLGFTDLMTQVRNHMKEEETLMFSKVTQYVPENALGALGDDVITFKESRGGIAP